jgi:hypothetical protein
VHGGRGGGAVVGVFLALVAVTGAVPVSVPLVAAVTVAVPPLAAVACLRRGQAAGTGLVGYRV